MATDQDRIKDCLTQYHFIHGERFFPAHIVEEIAQELSVKTALVKREITAFEDDMPIRTFAEEACLSQLPVGSLRSGKITFIVSSGDLIMYDGVPTLVVSGNDAWLSSEVNDFLQDLNVWWFRGWKSGSQAAYLCSVKRLLTPAMQAFNEQVEQAETTQITNRTDAVIQPSLF